MRTEFLGKSCPVCRAAFKDNDNVVVCPVCGTPHHRECYLKENKCGVESFHAEGFVWKGYLPDEKIPLQAPEKEETAENTEQFYEIPQDLGGVDPVADFLHRVGDKTIGEDGVSMKELTTFASSSIFHYEQAFRTFRGVKGEKKRRTFFNICSGFLAPTFQFYRKMDALGALLIVIMLLPTLFMAMNGGTDADSGSIYFFFNLLSITEQVLLCLFGDYIYYRHAVRQILKIREDFKENTDSYEYYAALKEAGRPSFLRATVGTLVYVLAVYLILLIPGN